MRLWVDDERPMPIGYDTHARTAPQAIFLIEQGGVTCVSLDHDLGPPEAGTGYDVAVAIERLAARHRIPPMELNVHTANPVGRERIWSALLNAERYWEEPQ